MDEVDAAMRDAVSTVAADSVVVGVSHSGRRSFVASGRLGSRVVTSETVHYGASLAKQVIGMLVALAERDAALHADDLLTRWVPEVARAAQGVRLRHLLHHTSGLRDGASPAMDTTETLARLLAPDADPIPPGQTFEYCNAGYVLLGVALERALGRPLEVIGRERVFDPLGMRETHFGAPLVRLSGTPDPPTSMGDGGLWLSGRDTVTWLESLNAGWPDTGTAKRVLTVTSLDRGTVLEYAWGVRVLGTEFGPRVTHGGSWHGWQSKTVRLPERRIAIAILTAGADGERVSSAAVTLAEQIAGWSA